MASSIKLLVAIRILRYALAANLVILSNNVSLNPGPTGPSLHSSFSSFSDGSSSDDSRVQMIPSIPQSCWKTAISPLTSILAWTTKD